ncbi:MAG TPA: hypothetical protein VGB82_18480 [Alphaproteobacteria bacterium]
MARPPQRDEDDEDDDQPSPWVNVGVLVFVALLIAVSVWVANALHNESKLEDCLMAGRTNCGPPIGR